MRGPLTDSVNVFDPRMTGRGSAESIYEKALCYKLTLLNFGEFPLISSASLVRTTLFSVNSWNRPDD